MTTSGFVTIGRVGRPHGLKGDCYVDSYAESPQLFLDVPAIFLCQAGRSQRHTVRDLRTQKDRVVMSLVGVTDRDAAAALTGREIRVRRSDLPDLAPGDVYLFELAGCLVVLEDGTQLGRIHEAQVMAGREIWTIRDEAGIEILFPAVPHFVKSVDTKAGRVVVAPPPGLVDLYRSGGDAEPVPGDGDDCT